MTDVRDEWAGAEDERGRDAPSAAAPEAKTFARMESAVGDLRSTLGRVQARTDAMRGQMRDWSQGRSEQARDMIDQRPITAIAAAFGLGLVAGVLMSR